MYICIYKSLVSGKLVCSKYGHEIKTSGCPYCPARPYNGRKPIQNPANKKTSVLHV